MNPESIWILIGVLFLGGAIGFYASRKPRPRDVGEERLRGNYMAGVNFLVNEQPDRALEAFLRAVELDDDTIETHFALGSLYRRRGEVDRAIKVHQNIATRESLEPSQREAFLLKHVEGLSYVDMMEVTGVGESALKMRVKRACERLRELLEGVYP